MLLVIGIVGTTVAPWQLFFQQSYIIDIALMDAAIIGASAVGLATSYALADVLGFKHLLHRKVSRAKGFYVSYAALMGLAAILVLSPGVPLGLLTEAVQVLAGVLLPSAIVFLVLLCNDRAVLGPWVNTRRTNALAAAIIWVLVLLSVILTSSVLFPNITGGQIVDVLGGGSVIGLLVGLYLVVRGRRVRAATLGVPVEWEKRDTWRMPPLSRLARPALSTRRKLGLIILRSYLVIAFLLVVVKVTQIAMK